MLIVVLLLSLLVVILAALLVRQSRQLAALEKPLSAGSDSSAPEPERPELAVTADPAAEKLDLIATMAGGVAHDLNNILAGVISYPELLLMRLEEDSPQRKPLETVRESGLRAATLVADLLAVSRDAARSCRAENLNMLVLEQLQSSVWQRLKQQLPELSVATQLADNLPRVFCSPSHVGQCLLDLMRVAVQVAEASQLTVATALVELTAEEMLAEGVGESRFVVLSVTDNGAALAEVDLARLFEPFYTTRELGCKGSGLELAVVRSSMREQSGFVRLQRQPDGGVFKLYFPLAKAAA